MTRAIVAIVASLALVAGIGALFGHAPGDLLSILLGGSLDETILKTVPLLLTGLTIVVAFKAGVWNIGGEGQFIAGALAAFVAARFGIVAALVASVLAGAAWASIASLLRWWRNAPEVLTTILLNFIAINLLGWYANAAKFAGVNVGAQVFRAMAISGACSGLAGGIELLGVTHRLFERFAAGYGYSGLAVALLAQPPPLGTIASAVLFGAVATG